MNQSFEIKELKRFCKSEEYVEFGISVEDLETQLNDCVQEILKEKFEFEITEGGSYFYTENLSNKLVLRKLNDNIKRIYKDEQANRRIIISQLKVLLEETCPFWVIKTDIKSFYESIKRDEILAKFQNDSILSFYSMFLLKQLFETPIIKSKTGVPRGINISATLSEIYLRKFDRWIRNFDGVYYYARFVDDIIIFSNSSKKALALIKEIKPQLSSLAEGLELNENKTQLFEGLKIDKLDILDGKIREKESHLEYLGYKFFKEKISKEKSKSEYQLIISIADKKIKKIKTRITLSFVDFLKNKNFTLLENRIKFITGNYSIKKGTEANDLKAGIYYNYQQVNDKEVLSELNNYYRKILFSKSNSLGTKINGNLTKAQKDRLKKYCFSTGFSLKVYNSFDYDTISKIICCW